MLKFKKMHGLGNDFIIIDQRETASKHLTAESVRAISDRQRGVGCDQLVVMERSEVADLFMRIYNADGDEVGACGNATRCIGHLWMSEQGVDECVIETISGLLRCRRVGDLMVEVDMGAPQSIEEKDLPYAKAVCVDVGNPHCVFFVEDAEAVLIETVGPQTESHEFFPHRTNVEFVQVLSPDKLRMRVWERGCGITQACGTGACATIVATVTRGLSDRKAEIVLDGGSLFLEWCTVDGHILMTGPVAYVFDGMLINPL